ncbi:MAG: LysE family translocator [Verrucomicrobiota bacterium]
MTNELWIFAGLITLGQFSPGPDMVLLTRTALREGRGAGLRMAWGITCGLMVHSTIAVTGVAAAFHRFPVMRQVLQWVAALYLLWLATGLLRAALGRPPLPSADGETARNISTQSPFRRGFLCNLLNPKVALFLAAVCAPFLAGAHSPAQPLALWAIVVGLGIGLWALWVVLLQWKPMRDFNDRSARWIDGFFGTALAALALSLMFA